ncbi:hypothetical protein IFM89_030105 [Coptis chinensis]|uniref:Uncharacterized protein n=1 Tax=Coptis chinensis TaxID=261450 RepID=A0A835I5Z6_9MAGN|nr:hypothetical protein IFM89_030105 [Coptis chinensis]
MQKECNFFAIEEGIVPGGGGALVHLSMFVPAIKEKFDDADERLGADIVQKALVAPASLIAHNAGVEGEVLAQFTEMTNRYAQEMQAVDGEKKHTQRKRRTKHTLWETEFHIPHGVNSGAPAYHYTKEQLGAVIFGCKHETMGECLRNWRMALTNSSSRLSTESSAGEDEKEDDNKDEDED